MFIARLNARNDRQFLPVKNGTVASHLSYQLRHYRHRYHQCRVAIDHLHPERWTFLPPVKLFR